MSGNYDPLILAVVHEFRKRFIPDGKIAWIADTQTGSMIIGESALAQRVVATVVRADLPSIGIEDIRTGRIILVECARLRPRDFASTRTTIARACRLPKTAFVLVNAYRRRAELAMCDTPLWGSVAWFADEPGHYIEFNGSRLRSLQERHSLRHADERR